MHLAIARRLPVLPPQRVWSEDQAAAEEEEEASLYFVMTDLAMRLLSMCSSSWGKAVDLTFQLQTTGTPSFVQSLVLTFSPRLLNRFPTRVVTLGAGDEGARDPIAYCMLSSVGCFPSPTQTKSCERSGSVSFIAMCPLRAECPATQSAWVRSHLIAENDHADARLRRSEIFRERLRELHDDQTALSGRRLSLAHLNRTALPRASEVEWRAPALENFGSPRQAA